MSRSQVGVLVFLSIGVCVTGLLLVGLLTRRPSPEVPVPETTETITETITTSKGTFTVPGPAWLDGRDPEAQPPLTIMSINVWDAVPRRAMLCALPHGTRVALLEARFYEPEERFYFLVRSGDCQGWLPESFVGDAYHPPIGDPL